MTAASLRTVRPSPAFRRQAPRFLAELPVRVLTVRPGELLSWDLSFCGLFLQTPDPVPVRRLLQLSLDNPITGQEVRLHGMVANVAELDDPEGRPQGMGVELYAADAGTTHAWRGLVRLVRDGFLDILR